MFGFKKTSVVNLKQFNEFTGAWQNNFSSRKNIVTRVARLDFQKICSIIPILINIQEPVIYTVINRELAKLIIIIIKKNWQCKAGRGRLTPYQYEDPSPTLPTYRGKEEKGKIVEDKKGEKQLGQQKDIVLALETRQSRTIEYGVNQIVPERY